MTRIRQTIVAAALVAVWAAPLSAQMVIPAARIDSVFIDLNRSDRPGCSLAIFQNGETAYARGYGMANLEYGIALSPRSVFHIASISKQFTAFAVELLVSEGKVSWDDDIRAYVPEIPDYGPTITLRHLAHHTSGIRDQWNLLSMAGWRWEADLVTQRDAIDVMSRQQALNFDPGDEYLYSNSGFTLLAAVVERVSGQTMRQFAEERIFAPLGMASTHFHDDHQTVVPDRAYGYQRDEAEGWKISIPDFAIVGASSLFTTVEDMARWDRNFRDHTLGDDALFDRLLSKGVLNSGEELTYAHGIIVSEYRGATAVGHGGADAGYRSNYLRFPEQDMGIVSFCNFAGANPGLFVRQVADIVLEAVLEPVADAAEAPDVDLDRWASTFEAMAGFYRDPRTDVPVHVFIFEGQARITSGLGRGRAGAPLIPLGGDRFQVGTSDDVLTVRMEDGRPVALVAEERRYPFVGRSPGRVDGDAYVGTYGSDELGTEYGVAVDTSNATNLFLVHRKLRRQRLRPWGPDGFSTGRGWITFIRGADGGVTGFTYSSGRVRKVRFLKR